MTRNALVEQAQALEAHLLYLEADDFAFARGFGPEIARTRRELCEVRVKITNKEFTR